MLLSSYDILKVLPILSKVFIKEVACLKYFLSKVVVQDFLSSSSMLTWSVSLVVMCVEVKEVMYFL